MNKLYIRALTIAGSDSGGGAGIQADLKTFSALGCYGMTALTALTAQNTLGVQEIYELTPLFVQQQIQSVLEDIGANVIKIGMLNRSEIIESVHAILSQDSYRQIPIVVDPVMIAKSGHYLLNDNAIVSLIEKILPLATIITPNLPEAEKILDREISSKEEMILAGEDLLKLGPQAVMVKGGHLSQDSHISWDCLIVKDCEPVWLSHPRIHTQNTHGTGCTLSAAIAAYLGKGKKIQEAVLLAKKYLSRALEIGASYKIGQGQGPVYHFHKEEA